MEHKAMASLASFIFLALLCNSLIAGGIELIVVNNCRETVWPAILGGAGHPSPANGGFQLGPTKEFVLHVPQGWTGRVWGRQGCCFDERGRGVCETGDCAGLLHCKGLGGQLPATLVEMTLGTDKSPLHYYDVSLVDGFNLPVSMVPNGGHRGDGGRWCAVAGCMADLNSCCPTRFAVRRGDGAGSKVVGCMSACLALKKDKYCCSGEYSTPGSCKPTLFSSMFKAICPRAYAYPFDDASSLFTCTAPRYVITFCPNYKR